MAVKILQCFKDFDTNGDGFISAGEMKSVLMRLDPDKFTEDRAHDVLAAADIDLDGRLSSEEFVSWLFKKSDADFRAAVNLESWECFPNLKAGFDAYASDVGYVQLDDIDALQALSRYLGLDTDVLGREMEGADIDSNGFVGFAEFALWADKNTVGVKLGLENLPDKRKWWLGMPKYWTSIEVPDKTDEEEEKAAPSIAAASFTPVPEDPDTSELEVLMKAAKRFNWKACCEVLDRHPGYIDMRPHYRSYATIHHAAYQGDPDILAMLIEQYGANAALPNKGGETPHHIATQRGKHLAADYLEAKLSGGDAKPARRRRGRGGGGAGGGGGKTKKQIMAATNEIVEKAKWQDWTAMFSMMEEWPECINQRPPYRRYAAIHQAAYAGNVDVLRRLVEDFKADPNLKTKTGETALEVAESAGKTSAVEYLESLTGDSVDLTGLAHELINRARDAQWSEAFELLQEHPGIMNLRPEPRRYAALHQAAYLGNVDVLRRMVEEFKADVKLQSSDGQTALEVAQENDKEEASAYLQAASPMMRLEDDFVTFPEQRFVPVTDEATIGILRNLCSITHKTHHNWTRDRMKASGFEDKHTPVPSGYEFVGAVRNEHPALWRIYQTMREVTRMDCSDPAKPGVERWLPWTMEDAELNWSGYDVSDEANEWMLFHASVPAAVKAICRSGFTMKTLGLGATGDSKSKLGLYGNGTYFTDCITKADEYARARVEDGEEFAGCRTLLVVRVVGGRHWYTDDEVKEEDKPEFAKRVLQGHYNSTVGDRFKLKNTFREIVAYDASGTFPEYIIYFKRQGVPPEHE